VSLECFLSFLVLTWVGTSHSLGFSLKDVSSFLEAPAFLGSLLFRENEGHCSF
jgi:hypothetical protein